MSLFVYDSSAYINGWRDHYPFECLRGIWDVIGAAIDDGRIVVPREVYQEIQQDDDLKRWLAKYRRMVCDPAPAIQTAAAAVDREIVARGGRRRGKDRADPWVIATAQVLGLTVVSYEGRDFTGPTKKWDTKMPGICQALGVPHCTMPQSFARLRMRL